MYGEKAGEKAHFALKILMVSNDCVNLGVPLFVANGQKASLSEKLLDEWFSSFTLSFLLLF